SWQLQASPSHWHRRVKALGMVPSFVVVKPPSAVRGFILQWGPLGYRSRRALAAFLLARSAGWATICRLGPKSWPMVQMEPARTAVSCFVDSRSFPKNPNEKRYFSTDERILGSEGEAQHPEISPGDGIKS